MLTHKSTSIIVVLVAIVFVSAGKCSEAGNWFTKSLDYYSLEKCSYLDKSNMAGDFNACLNSPVDPSSTSAAPNASSSGKTSGWGSSGSAQPAKQNKGFNFQGGSFSGSSPSTKQSSGDSWPISLITELQQIVNCFPKLLKPCMTKSEQDFYLTIRNFFQAQIVYASSNASSIAEKIASSGCVKSNSIDTSTVCFSTNLHKQNWFGWKINWIDGQMCSFINDISTCEVKSFDKCPPEVKQFADGLWKAGLKVTPCLNQTNATTVTTKASPSLPLNQSNNSSRNVLLSNSSQASGTVKLSASRTAVDRIGFANGNSDNNRTENYQLIRKPIKNQDQLNSDSDKRSNQKERFDRRSNFLRNIDAKDDFRGKLEHFKLVRLHEVDGEGESRHDRSNRHKGVTEEQWSRVKEEYRRKMRESQESRESDEDEYENESEESDEDKNYDIIGDQSRHIFFNPRLWRHQQRNNFDQEDNFGRFYRNGHLRLQRNAVDGAKDREDKEKEDKADEAERIQEEAEKQREIEDQRREEEEEEKRQKEEEEEEARQDEEERLKQTEERKQEKKKGKRLARNIKQSKKAKEQELEEAEEAREKEQEEAEAAREKEQEDAEEAREKEQEEAEEAREEEEEEEERRQELEEEKREAEEVKKRKGKQLTRSMMSSKKAKNQEWEKAEEAAEEEEERREKEREEAEEEEELRQELEEEEREKEEQEQERLRQIEEERKEKENEEKSGKKSKYIKRDIRGRRQWKDYEERDREEQERQRERFLERAGRVREEAIRRLEISERQSQEGEERLKRIREEVERRREKTERFGYLDEERVELLREESNRRQEEAERRREEGLRKRNTIKSHRYRDEERMEQMREEAERRREEAERRQFEEREDNDGENLIVRQQRYGKGNFMNNPFTNNHRNNNTNSNRDYSELTGLTLKDCIQNASTSWSYVSQNHKHDDIMEIMCRNIGSVHSCLNKHASTSDPSTSHHLNHLKVTHQALCDSNNKPKGLNQIEKLKQCIIDQQSSNLVTTTRQTRYPDISNRRPHWQ